MDVTAETQGPVEEALAAALGADLPGEGTVSVSAAPPGARLGFTCTVRGAADPAGACAVVAERLRALPWVGRVTDTAPAVYADVTPERLAELVVTRTLAAPGAYGSARAPARPGRRPLAVLMFSNPNTNKPLHLGHLRQNAFGMALSRLFEAGGWTVERADMLGDWGIHICYALVGYLRWGDEIGTRVAGLKGDHFAGRCLVRFHDENGRQREALGGEGQTELEAEARELLRRLEAGDRDLLRLARRFTDWVENGFGETHARIGTTFDVVVRESHARLRARALYEGGLARGVFARRPDGSVHADLTDAGLWDVTLMRGDGTTTAYVQHTGPEDELFEIYDFDRLVFVYGPDWETPHKASEELYRRLELPWAPRLEGLSHGLVSLPEGRMRSRSGTVLNVDQLADRVRDGLRAARGLSGPPGAGPVEEACETLAVTLLKFAFLRVPRQTDVVFDPDRFEQVAVPEFAAVLAALRTVDADPAPGVPPSSALLRAVNLFPTVLARALAQREPASVVRFLRQLAASVVDEAARAGGIEPGTAAAARAVLHRALAVLNLDLPPDLDVLPLAPVGRGTEPASISG